MFTDMQIQILSILISRLDREYYLSEIGGILGKKPGVFQRSITALEKQGLILSRKRGNQRLIKFNKNYVFVNEVKSIIQKTKGAEGLLGKLVNSIKQLSIALIYGSYAKDSLRAESDIDLLVVGDPKMEDKLLVALEKIEKKIQREINYKLYSKDEFVSKREENDPFLEEILYDKYILLKGKI